MGATGAPGRRRGAALVALPLLLAALARGSAAPEPGPILLYATKHEVRSTNASSRAAGGGKAAVVSIVKGLEKGIAVDFEHDERLVCWTDFELERIKCVALPDLKPALVVTQCVSYGLAVDWFARKLYWTDREKCRIEVADLRNATARRKVLFWSDLDEPRAIAVAPFHGLLFWTDWGEIAKIERASMDGDPRSRRVIVDKNLFWPNAITVDYETDKIYWLDARLLFIDAMDFDGGNRVTVMKDQLIYAVSLTVFRDKLYWADWKTWSIYSWDIGTGGPVRDVVRSEKEPTDVKVWDARRQPRPATPHPCLVDNGNCSHLCLLNPKGYSCACPTGVKLISKYRCADGPEAQIILVQKMAIRRISLDSPDYSSFVIPLKNIKNAVTVDYNPINKYFYWIDSDALTISRARIDGSNQSVVLYGNPDGIAVDSIAGNIYWTDSSTDTITVARLDGSSRKVIISEDLADPRAIALATPLGWMFWSDWSNHNIERASLDGTDRVVLVAKDLYWPNGIALDVKAKKIYWGDAFHHKIGVCNMNGSDRRELLSDNLHHIFGMTLLGDYIYWTDWQRRSLNRVNKLTGGDRKLLADQFKSVMGLTAFDLNEKPDTNNPCYENNGNCSHFCFNRPNDYVCGCPIDLEFGKDNRTCVKPTAFLIYARKNKIGRLSIENSDNHIILPVNNIKDASALTMHVSEGRIYWADSKLKTINRCSVNGSNVEKVIDWTNVIEGLALDWCGKNLYWTDFTAQRIEMSKLDGSHRRVLIWQGLKKPKSIALDPLNGYMYWSEWGRTIKRAHMDGSNPTVIVDQVVHAIALNIDYERKKLIWATMDPPSVEMSDLDGANRRKLLTDTIKMPYSLAINQDHFYWADFNTGDVGQASIMTGMNKSVIYKKLDDISGMILYHESRQSGTSPCSVNNGGCAHLCIPIPAASNDSPSTYKCACSTHYSLNKDDRTCSAPTEFILFSHGKGIGRVITDGSDCVDASLHLSGLKFVKSIEYDPVQRHIYWIDGRTHSIRHVSESGGDEVEVVTKGISSLNVDMALDAIGRVIYFTCPDSNTINMTRLSDNSNNASSVGVVIHGDGIKPRHIAVHQTQRLLFWADIAKGVIMSSFMDGSNRLEIAQAPNISALALNPYTDTVFWANAKQIYASSLDGSNKRMIWQGGSVMSLAVLKSTLYWIDNEKHLMHLPLDKKDAPALPLLRFPPLTDVIAVYKLDTKNPCMGGGGCAGVCLADKACGCVRGLLSNDGKSRCSLPPPCGKNQFTCSLNQLPHAHLIEKLQVQECIPEEWRCDGQDDCPNASDETNCNKCPEGKFKCLDDQCIDESQNCDGVKQCADGHDEFKCCSEPNSFRCPSNGICINAHFVCDQIAHCPDGDDESAGRCAEHAQNSSETPASNAKISYAIGLFGLALVAALLYAFYYCRSRIIAANRYPADDKAAADPLSPKAVNHNVNKPGNSSHSTNGNTNKMGMKLMDGMRMSALNGSSSNSYDRNNITGASSSATNGSSYVGRYPLEPLNPPPSPATTAPSSTAPSRHRPYRHYKVINQPPPPTPCSTDVCDESDCTTSYPILGFGMYLEAPPPTPCPPSPPSPSSRSSTYFSPLPPPPSPVPLHFDS